MPWRDIVAPARMTRVALVAPARLVRSMLVAVSAAAAVEIDKPAEGRQAQGEPGRSLPGPHSPEFPDADHLVRALSAAPPDLDTLRREGRYDVLAGEAELQDYAASAVPGAGAMALAGWIPADRVARLAGQLAEIGCAVVPLPLQARADVPTLLPGRATRRAIAGLVTTYGTVPYADIDPTWAAWASYILMFGMMFGDAGHGLLLIAAALCLRAGWPKSLARFSAAWPFVGGAGLAATLFGVLYGEFFGPTGVVPVLWLAPLARPIPLLVAAIAVGACLLACAYALGSINRWREGGWRLALYAPSGIAGSALFFGAAVAAGGLYFEVGPVVVAAAVIASAGLMLALVGFAAEAGGGGTGVMQVTIELFDLVVRLGSNVVSFARLAAFGLTHAAIGLVVWDGTRALWDRGGVFMFVAVILFIVGNALAFALEALVVAIQALRLEYYELFSRVFVTQGRPFRPWALPIVTLADASTNPAPLVSGERGT